MTTPGDPGPRWPARNDMRVTAGDFLSWDTWCGRTTAYVVIGNDNQHYGDFWVSLRTAAHHDEFFSCVPAGADWATAEEAAEFVEQSRSRWADGHPAVSESAVERWKVKRALRSRAQGHDIGPESSLRRLDALGPGDPPGLGL